jgi:uncharacterized protein YjiS (DUF1127 family)
MNPATTLNEQVVQNRPARAAGQPLAAKRSALERIGAFVIQAWQRSRSRRALLSMDDYMLKDVGLSRVDAHREARKFFWQT